MTMSLVHVVDRFCLHVGVGNEGGGVSMSNCLAFIKIG